MTDKYPAVDLLAALDTLEELARANATDKLEWHEATLTLDSAVFAHLASRLAGTPEGRGLWFGALKGAARMMPPAEH